MEKLVETILEKLSNIEAKLDHSRRSDVSPPPQPEPRRSSLDTPPPLPPPLPPLPPHRGSDHKIIFWDNRTIVQAMLNLVSHSQELHGHVHCIKVNKNIIIGMQLISHQTIRKILSSMFPLSVEPSIKTEKNSTVDTFRQ